MLGDNDNECTLSNILPDALTKPSKLPSDVEEVAFFQQTALVELFPYSPTQDTYSKIAQAINLSPVCFFNENNVHFSYMSSKNVIKRLMEYQENNRISLNSHIL